MRILVIEDDVATVKLLVFELEHDGHTVVGEVTGAAGNLDAKVDYRATDRLNGFFRVGYFREERNNGKISTIDGTRR